MNRSSLLASLRIGGYHKDQRLLAQLMTANRISYKSALDEFEMGQKQKAGGMKCHCIYCKYPNERKW